MLDREDNKPTRPEMSDEVYKGKRRIMLIFSIPMATFLIYRLYVLAPQVFPAFLSVLIITALLAGGYRYARRTIAMKCAGCGGAMVNEGVEKVIKGSLDPNDGSKLDSIAKRIYRCEECGNEYHELMYYPSSSGDAADYSKDMKLAETVLVVMHGEVPGGRNKLNPNTMTRDHYRELKRKLADEVILHNRRNGFEQHPIKIDLEE